MSMVIIKTKLSLVEFLEKNLQMHRVILLIASALFIAGSVLLFQRFGESEFLGLGFLGLTLILLLSDPMYNNNPARRVNRLGIGEIETRREHLLDSINRLLFVFLLSGLALVCFFVLFLAIEIEPGSNRMYYLIPVGFSGSALILSPFFISSKIKKAVRSHSKTL